MCVFKLTLPSSSKIETFCHTGCSSKFILEEERCFSLGSHIIYAIHDWRIRAIRVSVSVKNKTSEDDVLGAINRIRRLADD